MSLIKFFKEIRVAVTSPSFSNNDELCSLMRQHFTSVSFNQKGKLENGELIGFLKGHDAAIVGLDTITRDVINKLPQLRIISKYGVGLDNIDIAALQENNVQLGWTAGVNAFSVAELTLCFMIGLMRNVFRSSHALKNMQWKKDGGRQLFGKTIGIIGCGNVGKAVVNLLAPFKCRILANDIVDYASFYRKLNVEPVSFEELLQWSDIVSLHVPLDASTRHMINDKSLGLMKQTAFLVNTSRGGVVGTSALKDALTKSRIAGAALDVFEPEPPVDRELLRLENLMLSPHIGGSAEETVLAMGKSAIDHLVNFFSEQHFKGEATV